MCEWDANEFPAELDGTQFLENSFQLIQHSLLSWLFRENVSADFSFREVLLFVSNSYFFEDVRAVATYAAVSKHMVHFKIRFWAFWM